MNRTIEISSGTILRTIFILLLLWFLFLVRDVLALVFVAIIIVSAIDPVVDWFQKKNVPRSLTVFFVYVIFLSLFVLAVSLLIPPITAETESLGKSLPKLIEQLSGYFKVVQDFAATHSLEQNINNFFSNAAGRISDAGTNLFSGTISFLGGIFDFIIVLSIAFYMSVQEAGSKKFFKSVFPKDHQEYVAGLVERIQHKMGRWLQGQLLLMLLVFLLDYLGLLAIKAPYALILALIAGILEIIPYVGPIISAIIATLISFLHGPLTGVLVLGLFAAVQQLEGYVLTPLIMKKAVGLNPIIVILALLIGAKLGGVLGVIIAVPLATVIGEVVNDLTTKKEEIPT
ncbi:MAG: AI-2E family transporter [Parcubacteria group bacterium]|jgi:predicted PurR-regulated permease PerM